MPQATRGHPQGVYTNDPGQYVISTVPCGLVSFTVDVGGKGICYASIFDCATIPPAGEKMVVKLLTTETVSYSPCKPDACSKGMVLTVAGALSKVTLSIE
jgi:hypothetical protein